MSWRMIGKPIATAEMGTTDIHQKVTMPATPYLIAGVNVAVVFYNDPAFTDLAVRVYSDSAGSPGSLIATSEAYEKTEISTLDHAVKWVGFKFTNPFWAAANEDYHFVLYATGYTGDSSSHLAWRLSYPDPQFSSGITLDAVHATNHPLEISLVGVKA